MTANCQHKWLRSLLRPWAWCYGELMRWRNLFFDLRLLPSYESAYPVISVGNLTAGGNGKTPLCLFLAHGLKQRGFNPVILSRGYGGRQAGPGLVKTDDPPREVGDEPALLARSGPAPVVIARRRAAGARFIAEHSLGDVIILDDGFQHRRLKRCVDLVTIDVGSAAALMEFERGELLPLGRFRERRAAGLRRADLVVLFNRGGSGVEELPPAFLDLIPRGITLYRAHWSVAAPQSVVPGKALAKGPAAAFCAIAQPEPFFKILSELGFDLKERAIFPDHHRFRPDELAALQARHPGLPLICTAKDAVKIDPNWVPELYVLPVTACVVPGDALLVQLVKQIRQFKPRANHF